jgi:hypothetical protein
MNFQIRIFKSPFRNLCETNHSMIANATGLHSLRPMEFHGTATQAANPPPWVSRSVCFGHAFTAALIFDLLVRSVRSKSTPFGRLCGFYILFHRIDGIDVTSTLKSCRPQMPDFMSLHQDTFRTCTSVATGFHSAFEVPKEPRHGNFGNTICHLERRPCSAVRCLFGHVEPLFSFLSPLGKFV